MSRCPYCESELPGFETVCQKCFEAGYDRVTDTRPWWQRRELWHRPRLTLSILYMFLFGFAFLFVNFLLDAHVFHTAPTRDIKALALASFVIALIIALIESTRRKPSKDPKQKKAPE